MNLTDDFFTLFQLPLRHRIDQAELDKRYLALQSEVHPDRFVAATDEEKRLSMQKATRVNEGYQTLRHPLSRARYLLSLRGHELDTGSHTTTDTDFLQEQMEWREALMEARGANDRHGLEHLSTRLAGDLQNFYRTLAVLLDERQDNPAAADLVCRLMFLEKLHAQIHDALILLEEESAPDA